MTPTVRFLPAECPGCGAVVAAAYSRYRHARPHPLFGPLFGLGVGLGVTTVIVSLWLTGSLTVWILEGQVMTRKERGIIFFCFFAITLVPLGWVSRRWWRGIHRLPRRFEYECERCRWLGPCRVIETHAKV